MTQTQIQPRPDLVDGDPAGALADERVRALQADFLSTPAYRVAQNAVARQNVDDVALNNQVVFAADHTFSTGCRSRRSKRTCGRPSTSS